MKLIDLLRPKSAYSAQPVRSADSSKTLEKKKMPAREKLSQIQPGTSIQGTIKSTDNFYFNGSFTGDMQIENKLVLGENSNIKGNVFAQNVIVLGKLEGDVYAREKTVFGKTSNFNGKVSTKIIEVVNGAVFNAELTVRTPDPVEEKSINTEPINLIEEQKVDAELASNPDNAFFLEIFQNQ